MARVLVIDDDSDVRLMYRFALEGAGHVVLEAASGADGVRAAIEQRPECAIVDVGLPDLDGYTVATQIRRDEGPRAMRIIAVTGHSSAVHLARGVAAGFDLYLVKPVDLMALLAALTSSLDEKP